MSKNLTLYKYRSLENLEHVLDIILNERLYCSPYDKLNDPFEGLFMSEIHGNFSQNVFSGGIFKTDECKNIGETLLGFSKSKICSLSSSINDVRLWSLYSDGLKGIVIEVEFDSKELEINLFQVEYSEKLPFGGSTLLGSPTS